MDDQAGLIDSLHEAAFLRAVWPAALDAFEAARGGVLLPTYHPWITHRTASTPSQPEDPDIRRGRLDDLQSATRAHGRGASDNGIPARDPIT